MVLLGKIILVAIVAFIWLSFDSITGNVVKTPSDTDPYPSKDVKALTIATWNLQIFGVTKAANEELLQDYVSILDDFDIVFVQEIRDKGECGLDLAQHLSPSRAQDPDAPQLLLDGVLPVVAELGNLLSFLREQDVLQAKNNMEFCIATSLWKLEKVLN